MNGVHVVCQRINHFAIIHINKVNSIQYHLYYKKKLKELIYVVVNIQLKNLFVMVKLV